MSHKLFINLLGEFRIEYEGSPLSAFSADRLQSLLAYLLLHRSAPQPRHHLAFQLWPDSSESQSRTNLRNLLHNLRNQLPEAETFLEITNLTLQWRPDGPYLLDVEAFARARAAAAEAESIDAPAEARRHLEEAVDHYKGDLLPGNYDDWVLALREDLRHQHADVLVRLMNVLERLGDLRAALQFGQRLLHEDLLNETAYVSLMRLYALSGDRSGVRRIYQQCVTTLDRELGVEPSPATLSAYEQILRMEPAPLAIQPAATPLPAAPAPLPPRPRLSPPKSTTPFIGRERELAELAELLADPHVRLLSVTGPGGMGKTRLALQTARGHTTIFADGAAFVDLSPVSDVDLLSRTIAAGIGVKLSATGDDELELLAAIQDKEVLLVLDNFEHLLDGAPLLSSILDVAPAVKMVVTSRERLNLQQEWIYALSGLPIPEAGTDWQENSAVQLFAQSARRANASFALKPEDAKSIIRICALVEGMPLGIQLAAAWVRMLSPQEIADELVRSLSFLETTHRDVPERHRSLDAVVEHSWQLLSPREQRVLQALSVFRGGFDRSLAESVAGANLMILSSLVDKSLVRRTNSGRYSLHEVVRQYADAQLSKANATDDTRTQHLQAYCNLVDAIHHDLYGPMQPDLIDRLEQEHDNLRAALDWGLGRAVAADKAQSTAGEAAVCRQQGVRLAAILARFWYLRGHFHEGRTWLGRALNCVESAEPPAGSEDELKWIEARLLFGIGEMTAASESARKALEPLEKSIAIFRQLESRRDLVFVMHRFSETLGEAGELERAKLLVEETLPMAKALDDPWLMGRSLSIMSALASEVSDYVRAESLATEALQLLRKGRDTGTVVYLLNILGQAAAEHGDFDRAEALLEEALTINRTVTRLRMGAAWTLRNLGMVAQRRGDLRRARSYFQESLLLRYELRQLSGIAWAMEGLAQIEYVDGDPCRAVTLWAIATRLRTESGAEAGPEDQRNQQRSLETLADQLGQNAFNAAWNDGRKLSLDAAVTYALGTGD